MLTPLGTAVMSGEWLSLSLALPGGGLGRGMSCVWFMSLALILAGGSPAFGVSSSSLLIVLVSIILGCWALELSMMGVAV